MPKFTPPFKTAYITPGWGVPNTRSLQRVRTRQGIAFDFRIESRSAIPGALTKLPPLMKAESYAAAEAMRKAVDEAFETSGWGTWPPLAKETVAKREHHEHPEPEAILQETVKLRQSIAVTEGGGHGKRAVEFTFNVGPDSHAHGPDFYDHPTRMSNEELGLIHEFGDPGRSISERSFLRLAADREGPRIQTGLIARLDFAIESVIPAELAKAPVITYSSRVTARVGEGL